ncbi:MAG: hypothetical protein ABIU06_12440 [Anaerolineales bacterium]
MNEPILTQQQTENSDRYKNLIVGLNVFTTVLAIVLAALQVDANIRADVASRDSQYLAILASSELHRAGLESNYEFSVLGDYLKNQQEGTVLEITALEQETAGDEEAAQASREIAALSQARTGIGEKFSILYTDPRYAPENDGDPPNAEQYVTDVFERSNEMFEEQKKAADDYHNWDRKADLYVTALTIIAVAFLLFGLAQALNDARLRLIFAVFGIAVIGFSLLITITTLLS